MRPAQCDGAQVNVVGGSLGIGLVVAQRVAAPPRSVWRAPTVARAHPRLQVIAGQWSHDDQVVWYRSTWRISCRDASTR